MSYECPCPGAHRKSPIPISRWKRWWCVTATPTFCVVLCRLTNTSSIASSWLPSPEDKDTQRICEFHHVECLQTDALNSRWNKFCKGAGINEGLNRLDRDGWVVHLDADIWLPPQTRLLLQNANLDRHMVYGIDRFCVKGYAEWDQFLEKPALQHECDAYVHLNAFPLGTRVTSKDGGGYIPIGFFQMWCPEVSCVCEYPVAHTDAGRGDMVFAKFWPRAQRALIPEVVGYHLESSDASMSANWYGRKTAPFTHSGDKP